MDFRDRTTCDAVADIARLLAIAYQRSRRSRRIELASGDTPELANRELDNTRPESPHVSEVDACRRRSRRGSQRSPR